jgi:hypothetical protein
MKLEVKMCIKKVITFFVLVMIMTSSVQAMVIPGRWEKVAAEKPGSRIIVSLMTGDVLECSFVRLSEDSLFVATPQGVERNFSKDNVARITTADKRMGSLVNGTLIGAAAVGIPFGILALATAGEGDKGDAASVVAILTGIGAGIGLAVDAGVKGYITLYEAPGTPNP